MTIINERKALSLVKRISKLKEKAKLCDKKREELENELILLFGEQKNCSFKENTTLWTITLGKNVRYKFNAKGLSLLEEYPLTSEIWEHKPNMEACLLDKRLKMFINQTEGRQKILITKKEAK